MLLRVGQKVFSKFSVFFLLAAFFVFSAVQLNRLSWNQAESAQAAAVFGSPTSYGVGLNPGTNVYADFDKDGDIDLAVGNSSANTVSVLMNNGSGTFAAAVNYTAGGGAIGLVSGDFDKDGDVDLATANLSDSNTSILLNNGSGVFAAPVNYAVGGTPYYVDKADVDHDGDLDLVFARRGTDAAAVLFNNGSAVFGSLATYAVGSSPFWIFTADFDQDGDADLVTANESSSNISVLLNNGSGVYAAAVNYAMGGNVHAVTGGDVDKDGDIDLVVTNQSSAQVGVFLNNGNGTFAAVVTYALTGSANGVVLSDADNDGDRDILIAHNSSLSVLLNNGSGVYGAVTSYSAAGAIRLTAVDLDKDGDTDAAVSNLTGNTVHVLLNTGSNSASGTFNAAVNYASGTGAGSGCSADFNNDGKPDIAVSNFSGNSLSILINNGNGTFAAPVIYAAGSSAQNVVSADFNIDGNIDLAVTNENSANVSVFINNGDGTFAAAVNYGIGTGSFDITTADFNLDGKPDLISANSNSSNISVLLNNGAGTFAAAVNYPVSTSPQGIMSVDVNLDGKIDVAVSNSGSDSVSVLMNNGNGTFAAAINYAVGDNPIRIVSPDLNNDGQPDLVTAHQSSANISVLMNNGDGTFAAVVLYAAPANSPRVDTADYNNDGKADLALSTPGSNNIFVRLGNGDGTFAADSTYAVGSVPFGIFSGDFNLDGQVDLAATNTSTNNVSVLLNAGFVNTAPVLGFTADNVIPAAQMVQATNGSGLVTVNFKARDGQSDAVTLNNFEYSTNGGTSWTVVASISGAFGGGWPNNGGAGYATSASFGTTYSFTVNTKHADLASLNEIDSSTVRFRFKANDGALDSAFATSESFVLDNLAPEVLKAAAPSSKPTSGGTVLVMAVFRETHPGTNVFEAERNGAGYGPATPGQSGTAAPAAQATSVGALLDGDDTITKVRVTHTDTLGNATVTENTSLTGMQFLSKVPAQPSFGLNEPESVEIAADGTIYTVDEVGDHILIFHPETPGYQRIIGSEGSGDGQFNNPSDITMIADGSFYVSDAQNNRIQKFDADGNFVLKWGTSGTGNGQFSAPAGIAVDASGNVYVADSGNRRVQKFTSTGTFILTWGSTGSADGQFDSAVDVAIDSNGDVYVTDTSNQRVQKFDSSGNFILKWGTGGAGSGQFLTPIGIDIDASDNVYVSDLSVGAGRIQKFTTSGVFVSFVVSGFGAPTPGKFNSIGRVETDSAGNVYGADTTWHRIQKFTSSGTFLVAYGSRGNVDGLLDNPNDLKVDSSGNVFVLENNNNNRISKFSSSGAFITKWGGFGSTDGLLRFPQAIALDAADDLYVADTNNHRIQKFTNAGVFVAKWGSNGTGDGQFANPSGIAIDSSGNVYVADTDNNRIQKFTSAGVFITKWGSAGSGDGQFNQPVGLMLDASDNLFVVEAGNHRVQKFASDGTFLMKFGQAGSIDGRFVGPRAGMIDQGTGEIYIADGGNSRIQRFSAAGVFLSKFGSGGITEGKFHGSLNSPRGLALDNLGRIWAADFSNYRIQIIGEVSTVRPLVPQAPTLTAAVGSAGIVINPHAGETGAVNYAIKLVSTQTQYVQADSTLGTAPVYQGYAAWGGAGGVTVTGMTAAVVYTVSVQAQNPNGDVTLSAFGATANVTPESQGGGSIQIFLPSAPIALAGEARGDSIIRWNFTDQASNERGFRLYDSQSNILVESEGADQSWIEETGLTNNTRYEGRFVRAYNDRGVSGSSSTFAPVLTSMPAVTLRVIIRASDQITVGVNEAIVNLDQGQSALQFELLDTVSVSGRLRSAAAIQSPWIQQESYAFSDLESSHEYSIRVRARNQDGVETAWSQFAQAQTTAPNEVITEPVPPAPEPIVEPEPVPEEPGVPSEPPTPIEDTPVPPPTMEETQIIEEVFVAPVPTSSKPAPTSESSSEGPSFTVDVEDTTEKITVTGYAVMDDDRIEFTGTAAPNKNITLIFDGMVIVMTSSDAMGNWQTFVSAEQLGLEAGEMRNIRVESIVSGGQILGGRVPVGEVQVTLQQTGEIKGTFFSTVSASVTGTAIRRAQAQMARAIKDSEQEIQTTLAVALPAVIIASAPIWGYLPYIPTLLFHAISYAVAGIGSRKRKLRHFYGVVYDSISKQPLALAIIRVYRVMPEGGKKLTGTIVSDKLGRYDVLLEPGKYSLEVKKPAYEFPSRIVQQDVDASFEHVYRPEQGIEIASDAVAVPNVPLDPINMERVWQVAPTFKRVWMAVQRVGTYLDVPILLVGTLASFAVVAAVPDRPLNWLLAVVYLALLAMALRVHTQVMKAWGVVYDLATNAVLPLTTIQLIDAKLGKVVASRLSDYQGRFSFMPEPGQYAIKASKPGYIQVKEVMESPQAGHHPQNEVEIKKHHQRIDTDVAMQQQA